MKKRVAKAEAKAEEAVKARVMAETDRDVERYNHGVFKEETLFFRNNYPKLRENYEAAVAVIQMANIRHGTDYNVPMGSMDIQDTKTRGTNTRSDWR